MKLLSFILSFSILIQFQLISPWPAQAENKALLSSIEKAKVVLVKVEKDIEKYEIDGIYLPVCSIIVERAFSFTS